MVEWRLFAVVNLIVDADLPPIEGLVFACLVREELEVEPHVDLRRYRSGFPSDIDHNVVGSRRILHVVFDK